ncbi:hypothetical protein [Anaerosporobacter mobilis]|jgi:apolipoprotein N-acyltransferase|nr:hypothetical protein [Anaerosporobacter mobilis]
MGKQTVKVTIFHLGKNGFEKNVYDKCFWDEDQATAIKKSGLASVDSLYISIPYSVVQNLVINKTKDYIILGETDFEFDNTSQSTQSAGTRALIASHNTFIINSCSLKNHGSKRMWHWELSGK